ncbi:hypothetical protein SAMN05192553_106158 [Cyclobacterium xiamenense]|uniref:Uncharacterized protein n=1 Tax=Cyclobacterium xiamenense TaxID=1297121 RepID=A0A1H7AAD2_9BACT|nr:hypothetical protein SAMN05192553_106158 [Cyclobacterium xiamenense]
MRNPTIRLDFNFIFYLEGTVPQFSRRRCVSVKMPEPETSYFCFAASPGEWEKWAGMGIYRPISLNAGYGVTKELFPFFRQRPFSA